MSYLEIKNVNKYYGKFQALKNINLTIEKGEFISFLGPSGCGKTTLLRTISGLEELNSGHIFLKGKDISNLHPSKRNFSIVFQSYALFPNMTVWENIAYGLENKKMPKDKIKNKVLEVLEMVGLAGISNKYPNEMSGGQQQRVALARAIALEPDVLLLDEPLSALDAKVREKLRNDIKMLQKKLGLTTIMVTHDQEEALSVSDKIMVMQSGEVMQVGTPREIYEKPNSLFVADFIGKINFLSDGNSIRPEHIKIVSEIDSETENKTVMREVESWEYLGPSYRLFFRNNKELLKVEVPCEMIDEKNLCVGNKFLLEIDKNYYMNFNRV
ncbi:ATP-binding cassette domain-containing protein [Fusobacterium perfoetens]|uniref:ABC transporter ATP-binding protein n=1 Tax=Fusobacterium perfoetens TaxID=852 RepID=UPI001F3314BF|nr:ATP-binding cassette domain-containing protein [Fusobacterium perfoetens]MCF2625344.1 ATP-binding cassette domain-containing protein [Fusobacterium perfoetens]